MNAAASHHLNRAGQAVVSGAIFAVFPVCHIITPLLLRDVFPLCLFRAATGRPCPFCGATRAIALATHGQFRRAFEMNLAWPLFAAMMASLASLLITDAVTSRNRSSRLMQSFTRHWQWSVALLCGFEIWRIASGH